MAEKSLKIHHNVLIHISSSASMPIELFNLFSILNIFTFSYIHAEIAPFFLPFFQNYEIIILFLNKKKASYPQNIIFLLSWCFLK